MLLEQTLAKMGTMRLSTMATSLERRLKQGHQNDVSAEEFIGMLVDDEYTARQNRKLSRTISKANFKPEQACIENVKYAPARGFLKKDIMQFTSETWLTNAQNVIFVGPTGVGKSYLAEAIALQACKMGYTAWKVRFKRLFDEIREYKGTGQYLKFVGRIRQTSVIILDDFLMDPVSEQELSDLMDILEDRAQHTATIITTQYPVKKWHTVMPNPTVADAVCDRLTNAAIIFNLKGDGMRKKPEIID
jgi:DNA replication protein DnaC